jgi:hypothetical protein
MFVTILSMYCSEILIWQCLWVNTYGVYFWVALVHCNARTEIGMSGDGELNVLPSKENWQLDSGAVELGEVETGHPMTNSLIGLNFDARM